MSNLTINTMLELLKCNFEKFSYLNKIDIYKTVVFLEIKTKHLFFALEFSENGNIELVFRDDKTIKRFSDFFYYPFNKGTMIYANHLCINHIFQTMGYYTVNDHSLWLERVRFILDKCLSTEKDMYYLLSETLEINKKAHETSELKIRNDIYLDMTNFMHGKLLSMMDTMKLIKDKELSIARFGDGEINCMVTKNGCGFQTHDWRLMQELRDITSIKDDLLVCYPSLMIECPWWALYWPKYWSRCKFFLQREQYGDSFITRPEAFYMIGHSMIDLWKDIWQNKNICFVTGEGSRLNANHTIFDNIKNADYIYSKPKNAYDDIDNIMTQCRQKQNIDIFLIALGPTGTVLASRLHKIGQRTLDIGHLNNSYDTAFNNAPRPERQ